jgi:hypothetical protein
MEIRILKPRVPGITVRDPITGHNLPDEGKAIKMTTFWRRRLIDGSVVEVNAQPQKKPTTLSGKFPRAKLPNLEA